jgi:hypothetical protein
MSIQKSQNNPLRVAAPYYGDLNDPVRGLSHLYFLVDIDRSKREVSHMHVTVWNPSDDNLLGTWLNKMGVNALLCSSIEGCHKEELDASGVQTEEINRTDILAGINNWLRGSNPLPA